MIFRSLKKDTEFRRIYQAGSSVADRYLVIYRLKSPYNEPRIGLTVSKRLGKAVKRNRIKRLLREICRLNLKQFKKGYNYVIIARVAAQNRSYAELEKSLLGVLKKLNSGDK